MNVDAESIAVPIEEKALKADSQDKRDYCQIQYVVWKVFRHNSYQYLKRKWTVRDWLIIIKRFWIKVWFLQ